ncbi:TPA: hypothetical protein DEQ22_01265 [Candidatus Nomurabacteria bacterium]|uniref:Uncharacterized protein n=2 Tax=Candidatus Nomuraibacteriota TaxID=1752729 RepID=A0A1F6YN48_9BACT|nr:MAG: hypothetical protein UV13_C0007G0016 [Parcubacteria group bacterium GW2011_GWC1_42_21]KKS58738.1 MAG: hypothetical protein UV23_C0001G0005 [Candidatus Nomurabacteria bacterium GW2011_GWF1_42_40]KKT00062.1 MAG: hypothetical protein UV77_C0007G0016 [Candidatus Nomurabacteria bacterium GW2011_GWA1_43_17]KKT07997.1 MAG: hypothetical protein UV85_C0002G0016 [Candidatus Nomurabacteria bacterium GW2011_GWB1_43_19]KKT11547.1 MAG: hypothetical protein UV91_C0004G0016 [Candidatus Nomurabacteria b
MNLERKTGVSEQKKEIRLSWFIGNGREGVGIESVSFSTEFANLDEANIIRCMMEGGEENEKTVKRITGFSIDELEHKRMELKRRYRGKTRAPFNFDLV